MRKLTLTLLFFVLCLTAVSCGRHKLQPDEIERNRFFAEILAREDARDIGNDGFFEKTLTSAPYPDVREWCALALGRIGDPRALPALYAALKAKEASVRAVAAFAIGEIEDRELLAAEGRSPDPRGAAELKPLLNDPSISVQGRACEALGKIGDAAEAGEIIRRLEAFAYDGTPLQRAFLDLAVTALMRLKNPAAFPTLRNLAQSGDPEVQWRAENALIRMRDRDASEIFLSLLESPYPEVQAYAARGLGMTGNPAHAVHLFPLLSPLDGRTGRPNPLPVRVCAVQSLGRLRNASALPAIDQALNAEALDDSHANQVNFAREAVGALGELGAPAAVGLLARLVQQPGPVADASVVTLARLLKEDPNRFFVTVNNLQYPRLSWKRAWAQALAALGGERAALELKGVLDRAADANASTEDILAVPAILSALGVLAPPDLNKLLRPYLTSSDPVILRTAAVAYKAQPGTREPWAPLIEAYRAAIASGDLETKITILGRLQEWGGVPAVQDVLRRALEDRQRNVRVVAGKILRDSGAVDVPAAPGPADGAARDLCLALATVRKDRAIAVLETTRGEIDIELFPEDAPLTVANFVALARRGMGQEAFQARRGFYDGLSFMRVVPFFVVQGGDPRNDQEGGPGYNIRCEINLRPFERGSVGMALAGKDTGGSQFFITLAPQPHLDGGYTCFGRVIGGMQVVERLIPGDRINKVKIRDEVTFFDYREF